ncbi:TrgA family protein [Actibacterium lipolyticum]|uniref:Tellurium resistance protein n=1 Tax=Actibacterium lipolyticum TaxID=1524263 RepID=A0A238JY92_9RHOB|nr:TrgA family protein [Actibacterium lipolyticum]SMX34676.1 hypothetical protein COL8621_01432 [Actibacterium lipolyticum]
MPTAARLIAAICFAAVAYFASDSFKVLLPEGTKTDMFSEINALIGAIIGWRVMGRVAGHGYRDAINSGLQTSATMVFYVMLFHSVAQMLKNSTRLNYDGPMEAIVGIFELAVEYGAMMVTSAEVMIIVIVGGILAAWMTEWVAARWS